MAFRIDPEHMYDEVELRQQSHTFTQSALRRAREHQGLQCKVVSRGKRLYRGAWLLAWLEATSGGAK